VNPNRTWTGKILLQWTWTKPEPSKLCSSEPKPEMGKTRFGIGLERSMSFFSESDSEWSRSAFFVNLLESEWSRSVVSNYKIETKNGARVKCYFDVTIGFPNFENFGVGVDPEYDIRKYSESGWIWSWICRSRSGVGVRNKRLRPSLVD